MQETTPTIFFPYLVAFVGVVSGVVWNLHDRRIVKIEEEQEKCPYNKVAQDMAQVKTDIEWIKKYLKQN